VPLLRLPGELERPLLELLLSLGLLLLLERPLLERPLLELLLLLGLLLLLERPLLELRPLLERPSLRQLLQERLWRRALQERQLSLKALWPQVWQVILRLRVPLWRLLLQQAVRPLRVWRLLSRPFSWDYFWLFYHSPENSSFVTKNRG